MLTYATDMHWKNPDNTFAPSKLSGISIHTILPYYPHGHHRKNNSFQLPSAIDQSSARDVRVPNCEYIMGTWNIRVLTPILHHLYQSCMTYHLRSTSANSSGHRTCVDKDETTRRFKLSSASWLISSSSTDKTSGLWFVGSFLCAYYIPSGRCRKKNSCQLHLDHKSSQTWGGRFPIENKMQMGGFFFGFRLRLNQYWFNQHNPHWSEISETCLKISSIHNNDNNESNFHTAVFQQTDSEWPNLLFGGSKHEHKRTHLKPSIHSTFLWI